jgi:RNA polymerase sigma factor (TIGR02999 family)
VSLPPEPVSDVQTRAETGHRAPDRPASAETGVTELLLDFRGGDRDAVDLLLPLVYEELRRLAHRELRRECPDHTLSTTDLVHEAYLTLVDQTRSEAADRVCFFAVAATAMRRVLIQWARRRGALKRGGGVRPLSLDEGTIAADASAETLIELDEALTGLGALNARLARVVECRYFGGLTEEETAEALHVTTRTVRRDWVKAKGWLYRALHDSSA